ncbi:MAG: AraC family transcriptional regulator [Pseudorhodobacter sp.]|nr:AraC family transcriptional regulator [Pseudorhodobacter sp.]
MTVMSHSTATLPPAQRAGHWNAVIAEAYFPLHLTYRNAGSFDGKLKRQVLGDVSLSRLQTEPVQYERHPRHIAHTTEEQYLITIPLRAPVEFRQLGREVRCDPGGFIIERGDEPYRFSYEAANDLCVLKVAKPLLAARLRNPDRFCAQVFNGRDGLGGLFTTMAQQVQAQVQADLATDLAASGVLGRQLIELLTLAIDRSSDTADVAQSTVRAAHLRRAAEEIRRNLSNPHLSPDLVADACGISKRYLHEIFADANGTVSQHIREQRLIAARNLLQMPNPGPLSDIAYRFGFSDQAQFSRLFKAMFGQTPSGYRAAQTSR